MNYFVTGATGFIGGVLAKQLRAAGHHVVALVRDPAKASALAALGVQLAPGDITDRASMRAPMSGCDGVFHVAGWYKIGQKDSSPAIAINVEGTRNVLELMKELQIPKGMYTSTLAVNSDTHGALRDESYHFYGQHLSEYNRTKAAAHDLALQAIANGLPLVIVQPGLVYGPGDQSVVHDMLVQYLTRKLPMVPQGAAFCWAHVADIDAGHLIAMEHGRAGENYFLAGPPHTIREALQIAEHISGIPAPRLTAPAAMLRAMSAIMGRVERVVPVPDMFRSEYLRTTAGATYLGDNAKARRELGWSPRPLSEGLAETLAYEMRQLGMPPPGGTRTA